MKLTFFGAAHEVTGSCYYLEACNKKILIDCGMKQGADEFNDQDVPVNPSEIDYIFLTHAHIDHSGRLPMLTKLGFNGKIFSTLATKRLCDIMLRDSAHIQEFEAEWNNRKRERSGEELYEPLYSMIDAENTLNYFKTYNYNQKIGICEGININFIDAGHLLGSASIEIWINENNINKKIVFSGDIGNINQPLIKDPTYISQADYVIMECTYGDRNHNISTDYGTRLAAVIKKTFDKGGNVVIPSFAVGRTQELLYFLRDIVNNKLIEGYDGFSVYVDSPLAVEATNIYSKSVEDYYDEEAMGLINKGINPLNFPGLKLSITSDESKAINSDDSRKVIISASGMCDAGRIRHHLKHNLWRKESTVIFVGYQAEGTLGRALLNGVKSIKLFGESIIVRANIVNLEGISGHADQSGLIKWINAFSSKPEHIFITHGEASVCEYFSEYLKGQYNCNTTAPNYKSCYDLAEDKIIDEGTLTSHLTINKRLDIKPSHSYNRLVAAGERLLSIISKNKSKSNKDHAKFADQINSLSDRWE